MFYSEKIRAAKMKDKKLFRYLLVVLILLFGLELSGVWFVLIGMFLCTMLDYADGLIEGYHYRKKTTANFLNRFWNIKHWPSDD